MQNDMSTKRDWIIFTIAIIALLVLAVVIPIRISAGMDTFQWVITAIMVLVVVAVSTTLIIISLRNIMKIKTTNKK